MTEGPIHSYRRRVAAGEIKQDAAQEFAAEQLQLLHGRLKSYRPGRRKLLFGRPEPAPRSLYMYGGVGRGKSMLMDMFFDSAPQRLKRRVHFHEFMLEIHADAHAWRNMDAKSRAKHYGKIKGAGDDPVPHLAQKVRDAAILLCFDEMQVTDIADAMILGRLFAHLNELGVVIVATSNRHPSDLYKDGINRQLFLPFIDHICDRFDILELDGGTDYRLQRIAGSPTYFTPLGAAADAGMDAAWARVLGGATEQSETLTAQGRQLRAPRSGAGATRFHFDGLCRKPLGSADYLALAHRFHTLFLDAIPKLSVHERNEAKRFVTLIDALYENNVKLFCSAAAEPETLYDAGDGAFEFERTASRLREMQSEDYLAAGHGVRVAEPA